MGGLLFAAGKGIFGLKFYQVKMMTCCFDQRTQNCMVHEVRKKTCAAEDLLINWYIYVKKPSTIVLSCV
jgi:hypothetical protein